MQRQFQSKTSVTNYVLLAVMLSVALCLMWSADALPRQLAGLLIAVALLVMLLVIERMIHTTFTVTDSQLIVHRGRLSRDVVISISDIDRIDRINSCRIGGKALRTSLVVVTRDGRETFINPKNEEDFIKCISKRHS